MTTQKQYEFKRELLQFTGTESWYRHRLVRSILYTDGAKYVAEQGGAYWLLDSIAFAQKASPAVATEAFQVWTLAVHPDKTAVLTCEDGNGNAVYTQQLEYTDFPFEKVTLYFTNNVILLPSEY